MGRPGDGIKGSSGDGGPAVSAELNKPASVAVDQHGNLVIGDQGSNRVRMVAESTGTFYGQAMTAGDIYTIAGNGTAGNLGDGGPPAAAELDLPDSVGFDGAGNLFIVEGGPGRIRLVSR